MRFSRDDGLVIASERSTTSGLHVTSVGRFERGVYAAVWFEGRSEDGGWIVAHPAADAALGAGESPEVTVPQPSLVAAAVASGVGRAALFDFEAVPRVKSDTIVRAE